MFTIEFLLTSRGEYIFVNSFNVRETRRGNQEFYRFFS